MIYTTPTNLERKYTGLFIGTVIGDAIGLPREGLRPKRAQKFFGHKIKHSFLVIPYIKRISICSDDTDHLVITSFALQKYLNNPSEAVFAKELSNQIKRWFLTLPPGIGMATIKASLKLLVGVSCKKSGIFSAGNGAVMRAPILGAAYAHDFSCMQSLLKISTQMTHSDPKAFEGALTVATAASMLMRNDFSEPPITDFFAKIFPLIQGEELRNYLYMAQEGLLENESTEAFSQRLGLKKSGVSGYVNHTVPVVIFCWLRYFNDYRETITQIIKLGGDTDTNAAIVGALAGISVGEEGIPKEWINGTVNTPLSIDFLKKLAYSFCQNDGVQNVRIEQTDPPNFFFCLFKNLLSFPIILIHGFRRIFPPY